MKARGDVMFSKYRGLSLLLALCAASCASNDAEPPELRSATFPITLSPEVSVPASTADQEMPRLATNGQNVLVVWRDTAGSGSVLGARYDFSGQPIDVTPTTIFSGNDDHFAVASNGTDYLVVGVTGFAASGLLVDGATGATVGSSFSVPGGLEPAVGSNGTDFLVASAFNNKVDAQAVSATGQVGTEFTISSGAIVFDAGVGSNGSDFLVAWTDGRNSSFSREVFAARVDAAGTVLDPNGLVLSSLFSEPVRSRVASDGTDYLVTWHYDRLTFDYVEATRVSGAGMVLDMPAFAIGGSDSFSPAVAFDGVNYVVAYEARPSGSREVWADRVDRAGQLLDGTGAMAGFRIGPASAGGASSADIACNDSQECLVAYEFVDAAGGTSSVILRPLSTASDRDGDGLFDSQDNCPDASNPGQDDVDADGVGDACDNCPSMANADQSLVGLCLIDGVCYGDGTPNPDNPCEVCDAQVDSMWSPDDTAVCDDGRTCSNGACVDPAGEDMGSGSADMGGPVTDMGGPTMPDMGGSGTSDMGVSDMGESDLGTSNPPPDAGEPGTGPGSDGGTGSDEQDADGPPVVLGESDGGGDGCACASVGGTRPVSSPLIILMLTAIGMFLRRRR